MRTNGLLALLFTAAACGSAGAGGDDSGAGSGAANGDGGDHDAGPQADAREAAVSADAGSASDATEASSASDAADDGQLGDADSAAPCTGTPQPIQATCIADLTDSGSLSNPTYCFEFTGSTFATPGESMADCDLLGGVLTTQPCPTAGVVGKCIDSCGQPSETVLYAYASTCNCTAASLQQSCIMNGDYFLP